MCMKSALRCDPENPNASDMRVKLSLAQFTVQVVNEGKVFTRFVFLTNVKQDYVGFLETRTQILQANIAESRSWGPCAIAAHFMGDHGSFAYFRVMHCLCWTLLFSNELSQS